MPTLDVCDCYIFMMIRSCFLLYIQRSAAILIPQHPILKFRVDAHIICEMHTKNLLK